jgi:hypothetical protein
MGTVLLGVLAILWVVSILVAESIGNAKGRQGIVYGIFLSWLGVLTVYMLPPLPATSPAGRGDHYA